MESTIYLIGPRGAGKTTVGKALSLSLDYQFIDTDNWITDKYQQTISSMVEAEGFGMSFRQLESDALIQVSQPNQVISTGRDSVGRKKSCLYEKFRCNCLFTSFT